MDNEEKTNDIGRIRDLQKITQEIAEEIQFKGKPLRNAEGNLTYDKNHKLIIWEKYYSGLLVTNSIEATSIYDCDPIQHSYNVREDIKTSTSITEEIVK